MHSRWIANIASLQTPRLLQKVSVGPMTPLPISFLLVVTKTRKQMLLDALKSP